MILLPEPSEAILGQNGFVITYPRLATQSIAYVRLQKSIVHKLCPKVQRGFGRFRQGSDAGAEQQRICIRLPKL